MCKVKGVKVNVFYIHVTSSRLIMNVKYLFNMFLVNDRTLTIKKTA